MKALGRMEDESDSWWNDDGSWGYVGVLGPQVIMGVVADFNGSEQPPKVRLFIDDRPGPLLDFQAPAHEWRDKGFTGAQVFVANLAQLPLDEPVDLSVRFDHSGTLLPNGGPIRYVPPKRPEPEPVPAPEPEPAALPAPIPPAGPIDEPAGPVDERTFAALHAHIDAGLARLESRMVALPASASPVNSIDGEALAALAARIDAGLARLESRMAALPASASPVNPIDGEALAALEARIDAGLARLEAKIDAKSDLMIAEGRAGFAWLEPKLDALLSNWLRQPVARILLAGVVASAFFALVSLLILIWK